MLSQSLKVEIAITIFANLSITTIFAQTDPFKIGLYVHIIRFENESGGIDDADLATGINHLNGVFENILIDADSSDREMEFFIVAKVYHDDDEYASWTQVPDLNTMIMNENKWENNAINLYITPANKIGVASLPAHRADLINLGPGENLENGIVIKNTAVINMGTMPHEFGHYFGLFHTYEQGGGREYVTRITTDTCYNALSAGDFLHDTAAEPDAQELNWTGVNCDAIFQLNTSDCNHNSETYNNTLNRNNFMAKSEVHCRTQFTTDQKELMANTFLSNGRTGLKDILWVQFENQVSGTDAGGEFKVFNASTEVLKSGDYYRFPATSVDVETTEDRLQGLNKHRIWNNNATDFKLRLLNFQAALNQPKQTATFTSLTPTEISTFLVSTAQIDLGAIEFHDPWYVSDINNTQPNQFISENSLPFSPKGKFNESTGGIFLNLTPGIDPVVYSIRALDQIINGKNYFLDEWTSTGGVNFTNANASTTSLEFTGTSTTVTANLKAYFASSTKTATFGSNGLKLGTHVNSSDLHLVYIDNGRLYYTKSTNGGVTWAKEKRLDSSSSYDCLNPSIGVESNGNVHIVYERENIGSQSTQYDVQYIAYSNGSWSASEALDIGNIDIHPRPTIHVGYYGDVWVAWRKNDTRFEEYNISFKFKEGGSSSWTASSIVPDTDNFSWSPTLIHGDFDTNSNNTHVFWHDASEQIIKYISGDYQSSNWTWDSQADMLPGLSILSEHNKPSVQANPDTLYVTWQATEEGVNETKRKTSPNLSMSCPPVTMDYPVVCFQKYSGTWEGLTIFRTNSTCDRKPVLTSWATSLGRQVMIAFEKSEDVVATVLRDESGAWGNLTTLSSGGANPAITSVTDSEPNLVYTSSTGVPRPLVFEDDLLPPPSKDGEEEDMPHSRLVALRIDDDLDGGPIVGINGDLVVEIGDLEHHMQGAIQRVKPRFRNSQVTGDNAFAFNDVDITSEQGVLKLPIYIRGLHLSHPGNNKGRILPILDLQLRDAIGNTTLQTVKTYRTSIIGTGSKFELVDTVEVDLSGISTSKIYIKGKLFLQKNHRNVRIAEVYDLRDELAPEQAAGENPIDETPVLSKTSDKLPTEFKLEQNFPNPFNPKTQISFELPKPGFVKLKIFDVNGRLVNNLVYRQMEAGRYTVSWNGKNSNGQPVSSGIYLYRLVAANFAITKKMTLIQ